MVQGSPKIGQLFEVCVIEECGPLTDEKIGNAKLIWEAFNVANESGLTPRQLLDENINLHAQIKELTKTDF